MTQFIKNNPPIVSNLKSQVGNYHKLKNYFMGMDVYIVCSGSSMDGFDYELLEGKKTIVVNSQMFNVKNPSMLALSDWQFVEGIENTKQIKIDPYSLPYPVIAGQNSRLEAKENVSIFKKIPKWSDNYITGLFGCNSGAMAMNAAWIFGARKIYLLGMDAGIIDGKIHPYDDSWTRPNMLSENWVNEYKTKIERTMAMNKNVNNIFNLSQKSKLNCFPKLSYKQAGLI